jgi:light-regulated signal transduction histidine kinase (bacteriophytochrome)
VILLVKDNNSYIKPKFFTQHLKAVQRKARKKETHGYSTGEDIAYHKCLTENSEGNSKIESKWDLFWK